MEKIIVTLRENVYRDPVGCWRSNDTKKKKKVVEIDCFCIGQQLLLGHWVASADI